MHSPMRARAHGAYVALTCTYECAFAHTHTHTHTHIRMLPSLVQGNVSSVAFMRRQQFLRLCRHARLASAHVSPSTSPTRVPHASISSRPPSPASGGARLLSDAEIGIIYTAAAAIDSSRGGGGKVKGKGTINGKGKGKLDFGAFLDALRRLAADVYLRRSSKACAFSASAAAAAAPQQQRALAALLREHILPHARCRARRSVEGLLAHPALRAYLRRVAPPLRRVFAYYAALSAADGDGGGGGADDTSVADAVDGSNDIGGDGCLRLGYHAYLNVFCQDFLCRPLPLSKHHQAEAFLAAAAPPPAAPPSPLASSSARRRLRAPSLSFDAFVECIVRCALIAYRGRARVPVVTKVKETLLLLGRRVHVVAPQRGNFAVNTHGTSAATDAHPLLDGAKRLQRLTMAIAAEDGVDGDTGSYLRRRRSPPRTGQQMLHALSAFDIVK